MTMTMTPSIAPGSVPLAGEMRLLDLVQATGGRPCGADVALRGVCTDTRYLKPGDLFVALQGPRFDGHDFLGEAHARGAAAALVARTAGIGLPTVVVPDTLEALGRLARWWRARFAGVELAAVTGSNGKTTVRELLAAILGRRGPVLVTRGNLNNAIGVPLTVLGLDSEHRAAVIEMGARAPGDIAWLAHVAQPDVAIVTNAARAHLAGFGNVAGVARAKGELLAGLGPEGIAVFPADDPQALLWRERAGDRPLVRFAVDADVAAEVSARDLEPGPESTAFDLHTPAGTARVRLRLPGLHNVRNALAAAAGAVAMGADLGEIAAGLDAAGPVPRRLQPRAGRWGARLIDDTYNANPDSVRAALEVLSRGDGERLLVIGDLGDLGPAAAEQHTEIGRAARRAGVTRLHALGDLTSRTAAAFGAGACHHPDHDSLIAAVLDDLATGGQATVLIKGSRFMRMEEIADALAADPAEAPDGLGG